MIRSFDSDVMQKAFTLLPDDNSDIDFDAWLKDGNNVMLVSGEDVGCATYEYPGVYTVHWFYKSRGRAALNLAREMLHEMFTNYGMETARGLTPETIPQAIRLAKYMGFKSFDTIVFPDKEVPYELLLLNKKEFYNGS